MLNPLAPMTTRMVSARINPDVTLTGDALEGLLWQEPRLLDGPGGEWAGFCVVTGAEVVGSSVVLALEVTVPAEGVLPVDGEYGWRMAGLEVEAVWRRVR